MYSIRKANESKSRWLMMMIGVITIGALLGVTMAIAAPSNIFPWNAENEADASHTLAVPGPSDLDELVNRVDAVVIGKVSMPERSAYEGGFDSSTEQFTECDSRECGLPVTYYAVQINEVLLDDGFVLDNPLLRISGFVEDSAEVHPKADQEYVMFLWRNPENSSYGYPGAWNVVSLEDGKARDLFGDPIEFHDNDAEEFMADVRQSSIDKDTSLPEKN